VSRSSEFLERKRTRTYYDILVLFDITVPKLKDNYECENEERNK